VLAPAEDPTTVRPPGHWAGEPWFDPDFRVCPVVAAFLGAWNDDLPRDERGALIAPLAASIAGSRNAALETARALLIGDWLIRIQTVAWLRLARAHVAADDLERGPRLIDSAGAAALLTPLKAAQWAAVDVRDAAWATPAGAATPEERAAHLGRTWEAPWAIAAQAWSNVGLDEARDATSAAGLEAARAAVWAVANMRAHADVWNLAYDTARTAAHAGFCLAGQRALRAAGDTLKRSAADLVVAMIEAR
jgi:hypothetical protein